MRKRETLLCRSVVALAALALALAATRASAQPTGRSAVRNPATPEKDACGKQAEVLGKYGVKEGADIRGLENKDGKYVEKGGEETACPNSDALRGAVETTLEQEATERDQAQEMQRFRALGIAGGEDHVKSLKTEQLRLLNSIVGANAVTKHHFKNLDELKLLSAEMKRVSGPNPLSELHRFFDNTKVRLGDRGQVVANALPRDNALFAYWDRTRDPFDRSDSHRLQAAGGIQFQPPPVPTVDELLVKAYAGKYEGRVSPKWVSDLKKTSPAEYERLKSGLLAMTGFRSSEVRTNGLTLLGQIDGRAHTDMFIDLLGDLSVHRTVLSAIHGFIVTAMKETGAGASKDAQTLEKIKTRLVQETAEAKGERLESLLGVLATYGDPALAPTFLKNLRSERGRNGLYRLLSKVQDEKGYLRKDAESVAQADVLRKGLLERVSSEDPETSREALAMLAHMRDARLTETFLLHFKNPTAASGLSSVIHTLRYEQTHGSPDAAGKLGKIRETLMTMLKTETGPMRVNAMKTLHAFGEDSLASMFMDLTKEPELVNDARNLVLDHLYRRQDRNDPNATAALKEMIKAKAIPLVDHPSIQVSVNALELLGKLEDPSVAGILLKYVKHETKGATALDALSEVLYRRLPLDPVVRAEVRKLALEFTAPANDRETRRRGMSMLRQLNDPTVIPHLLSLLGQRELAGHVESALAALTSKPANIPPEMKALLLETMLPLADSTDRDLGPLARRVLSDLGDQSMQDFFFKRLEEGKEQSAEPLLKLARAFSSAGPTEYMGKMPEFVRRLVQATRGLSRNDANWAVINSLGHLNSFNDAQVAEFAKRFDDPKNDVKVLLEIIGASSPNDEVNERSGLHGNVARELYKRALELAGKNPLSSYMKDETAEDRNRTARILSRLQRYALLQPDFAKDPALAKLIANVAFSGHPSIAVQQTFAFGEQLRQAGGASFVEGLIARAAARDRTGGFDPGIALLYMGMNLGEFPEKQQGAVEAMMKERFSEELRTLIADRREVPFYAGWDKPIARGKDGQGVWDREKPLRIAINMTQEDHALLFMTHLRTRGFAQQSKTPMNAAEPAKRYDAYKLINRATGGQPIELHINVLPSNKGGWVNNKDLLNELVTSQWKNPDFHVVGSRAHSGEIRPRLISEIETQNKLYVDGACGGASAAAMAVGPNCKHCTSFASIGTGEGHLNNPAFERLFRMLSQRKNFPDIVSGFRAAGVPTHRFTVDLGRSDTFRRVATEASYFSFLNQ
ncbi:MAG: hypothetical protein HY078_02770 [Elusimicrobia bacterium]|nr:hypothetical protein [Elusimicrobiota bacterium]